MERSTQSAGASRHTRLALAGVLALGLSACSQSETPFVDMCQKIAGNLVTGSISNWDSVEKFSGEDNLKVVLAWSGDADGTATCTFDAEGNEKYQASPGTVVLNGEKVPFRQLLAAAAKSSGKIIGDAAEQTAENTKKLASEASERAEELADTAKERATELAGQASETASELAGKAREVAGEVGDKAREAALDATKAVQQKLEK